MPTIKLAGSFDNDYQDLQKQDPNIKTIVDQKVIWFSRNPDDTRLENHPLKKPMTGKWAFSITDDIRIVYKWVSKTTVRFLSIGPHVKVYKKQYPKR